ncbi:FAD binding domain-containing protein [Haliscomenobacter hydrossis]|uniref:Carbon-monoxide dehydrogenase (Acceptor) n=1 Tax=Haliscomenobacter hydrossis (strain ATCC 27775 / DSM 1100 / LMG 10767 / O) TaxID=760192 RepID=F4L783_HALH1|nr:xanthine dehydrogenase family protein subunit M [Haliscomenobacter hydrossis]AEE53110.1 Carbon-monoxide dehydrogenase (acceptor) [Haliscomenobacter hydrossis DSM 1100]
MIPQAFNYEAPTTLAGAIALLQKYGSDAKIMSGGHSLIPMMKLRLATPEHVIDISGIKGMEYIHEEGGYLKIGALTKEVALEESQLIHSKYPLITDATKMIADPSVRNLATVGGNLAHGDAANDHPAVMLALRATVLASGPNGDREISIDDFFLGFFTTALEADEILTEIRIPIPPARSGGAYLKMERKVGDYATAGVAVQLSLDASGHCQQIGIALTNVSAASLRSSRAEEALRGQMLSDDLIQKAATMAAQDCDPNADLRGSVAYKRSIVKTLVARAIHIAVERAGVQ